jgi:hypothetical protein
MRSEWLKPFACGVAAASLASTSAWFYSVSNRTPKTLILTYVKAEGLDDAKLPPDPAPQFEEPLEYVLQIAQICGAASRPMQSRLDLDAPVTAQLELPLNEISEESFGCLSNYLRPRRVTLTLKTSNVQAY